MRGGNYAGGASAASPKLPFPHVLSPPSTRRGTKDPPWVAPASGGASRAFRPAPRRAGKGCLSRLRVLRGSICSDACNAVEAAASKERGKGFGGTPKPTRRRRVLPGEMLPLFVPFMVKARGGKRSFGLAVLAPPLRRDSAYSRRRLRGGRSAATPGLFFGFRLSGFGFPSVLRSLGSLNFRRAFPFPSSFGATRRTAFVAGAGKTRTDTAPPARPVRTTAAAGLPG